MEIVGAQVTGAPAIVSSIPSDGLIKQFGIDIGEGDEILSVNGHLLRNRSDLEIDHIIGQSALETQGELELLVVKQLSNLSTNDTNIEEDRANEEVISSDAQIKAAKNRVVSSSSSSLTSNSSSSTNGPRPIRANSQNTQEHVLNNIDENEPVVESFKGLRRNSVNSKSKKVANVNNGEGTIVNFELRGFKLM